MRVERFVEIDAPVEQVFDAFGDFESVPRWMRNVRDVRRTGRRTTRWTADTHSDEPFEWDVETTVYEPDRRIVWRSIGGDVDTDGEMVLQETQYGTTLMRLVISYYPTGGQNGPAVARFFGRNAEQQLEEDLERLKRDLERRAGVRRRRDYDADADRVSRRTRRSDEDDAPRRTSRPLDVRESRPSGRIYQADAGFSRHGREPLRDEQRRDSSRLRDDYSSGDYRARNDRHNRHDDGHDERDRERRFDEALREARRSQLESMRRYEEERERARRRRAAEDNRFREAAGAEARTRRHHHEDEAAHHEDNARHEDESPRRPRHALTPREREMAERRTERDMSGRMLRRGVDRLLDDAPPSSRWRKRD